MRQRALDAAVTVFWTKGYEGASYEDLSNATGVARPGLYAAFGNKEEFFRKAVQRYEDQFTSYVADAFEMPRARDVVRLILEGSVEAQTAFPERRGCMIINGTMDSSDESKAVRQYLISRRSAAEEALFDRLKRAQAEGDLPPVADCAMLACFVMTVSHGIAVQAKTGAAEATLNSMIEHALSTWPS